MISQRAQVRVLVRTCGVVGSMASARTYCGVQNQRAPWQTRRLAVAASQVLDEINDQTDQMEQIQQAMGQPIGSAADIDEDDLLNELEVRPATLLVATGPCLTCSGVWTSGRSICCLYRYPTVTK